MSPLPTILIIESQKRKRNFDFNQAKKTTKENQDVNDVNKNKTEKLKKNTKEIKTI